MQRRRWRARAIRKRSGAPAWAAARHTSDHYRIFVRRDPRLHRARRRRGQTPGQKQPPSWVFDKRETVNVPWRILQGESDQVCDPKFAPDFAAGQKDSKAIMLPKVGHGFGVPRNWMPQYVQSVKDLLDSGR